MNFGAGKKLFNEMCRTESYGRFGGRAASVRTTVQLGVSRSTGLRSLARISRRPIGVETARRAATLPRVYRTLGLTPVTALLPSRRPPPHPAEMRVPVLSLSPSSPLFRALSRSSFSLALALLSGNCTRVAMGIQFSLSRSSRVEHFHERNRANVPITSV